MSAVRDWGSVQLHQGDCREVMRTLGENSIDAIVTDPPYELGFMGKAWDRSGVANDVHTWTEALRALKPGGYLLAFSGTRTYHRMVCAIEDAGIEIRDQIAWAYGSGFPKSHNGPWGGTALKPAWEPICMARKPLERGLTVAENFAKWGTGALNIDGCRVPYAGTDDAAAAAAAAAEIRGRQTQRNVEGWGMQAQQVDRDEYLQGAAGLGRWPANVIHDGSDEVLDAFPFASGAVAPVTHRNVDGDATRHAYGKYNGGRATSDRRDGGGSAARFFYCAKASKSDRGDGNVHPTVKPNDLMRYLCRLVTPPSGIVLDPFMGSGSTGKAARLEGLRFIGIEREHQYLAIAERRMFPWAFGVAA